jgi:hypothetical protein
MKISPYTSYLELHPNALLVRQNFYYLQKVGVTPLHMHVEPPVSYTIFAPHVFVLELKR